MQTQVFYLKARSPFHFGERGVGLEATGVIAHADTLFSALCITCREQHGLETLENLLGAFLSDPPFLMTSAFPYLALPGGGVIRLYPRPLGRPPGVRDDETLKDIKKVRFVSGEVFEHWIAGEPSPLYLLSVNPEDKERTVWVTADEAEALGGSPLWRIDEVPRVTVDRASSASQVYQAGRVRFAPGNGLWVALYWRDEQWQPCIEELLHALGDSGLGGERSAGHGQFCVAGSEWIDLPDPSARFVTLSTYWPQREEAPIALGEGAAYTLSVRRGWMGSPDNSALRRKAVRMVGEGSVLNLPPGKAVLGDLADVTPEKFKTHKVYRYGYAFPVGMEAV